MGALAWIGAALVVLWLLGWLVFKIASRLIHLVVAVGAPLLIWGLVRRGANAVRRA